jgi:hypothetical protein
MIHLLVMLCALAEGFMLWFLLALIRERRRDTPCAGKADLMNPGTISYEHAENVTMNLFTLFHFRRQRSALDFREDNSLAIPVELVVRRRYRA